MFRGEIARSKLEKSLGCRTSPPRAVCSTVFGVWRRKVAHSVPNAGSIRFFDDGSAAVVQKPETQGGDAAGGVAVYRPADAVPSLFLSVAFSLYISRFLLLSLSLSSSRSRCLSLSQSL